VKIQGRSYRTLWEADGGASVEVIDQRCLPHRLVTRVLRTPEDTASAITEMWVRGAPLIGAVAAYGLHLAVHVAPDEVVDDALERADRLLGATRPTAVNLRWALDSARARIARGATPAERRALALEAAREVTAAELERSRAIGAAGLPLLAEIAARRGDAVRVLTHCNAGWLATVDHGTATAPVYAAHERGIPLHVWVDETRPRNQGASLTAFELAEEGVPHALVVDNAGGHLMQQGQVDVVIVGADRVAANGDTANKIGTYLKALAAHDNGVPFYVALPSSTIDWSLPDGRAIPIEERSADEVRYVEGLGPHGPERVLVTTATTPARNPGFDVTPARLVTGFITEHGVLTSAELGRLHGR
jgi:methylthioribose-1-phosphate isomerase